MAIHRIAAELWQVNGFQNGGRPPSWIFKFEFLTVGMVQRANMHQPVKFRSVKALLRYGNFSIFFQNGGRPPSWICCVIRIAF